LRIEALIRNQSKSNYIKMDDTDVIRKYKQLFNDGIITQEEFQAKKKEILGLQASYPISKATDLVNHMPWYNSIKNKGS
jgi:hypothetical protein